MRLLLVEDADRLRRSLLMGLRREGFAVDEAANGTEGLELALARPYDVLVLDIMLPGMDGLEILRRVRAAKQTTPVLMLTARDSVFDRVEGLSTGADDYLVKPFAFAELVARIRALVRRSFSQVDPHIEIENLVVDPQAGAARCDEQEVPLTRREYQLLELLALRKGQIVSRRDIEAALYEGDAIPNSNAIDSAVCRVRGKLEQAGVTAEIKTARGRGYVLSASGA